MYFPSKKEMLRQRFNLSFINNRVFLEYFYHLPTNILYHTNRKYSQRLKNNGQRVVDILYYRDPTIGRCRTLSNDHTERRKGKEKENVRVR